MNIIVCVDKNGGMMFNGRRQSSDRVVTEKIKELAGRKRLLMSEYSSGLFSDIIAMACAADDFLSFAGPEDFCFIEDAEIPSSGVGDVYIFNWNRDYPADRYFDFDLSEYRRAEKSEFEGSSHKKITLEVYRK